MLVGQSPAFISITSMKLIGNKKRESLGESNHRTREYTIPGIRRKNSRKARGNSGNLGKNSQDMSLKEN